MFGEAMKNPFVHYTIQEGEGWRAVVKVGTRVLTNRWFKDRAQAREHNANVMANGLIERKTTLIGYSLKDFMGTEEPDANQ